MKIRWSILNGLVAFAIAALSLGVVYAFSEPDPPMWAGLMFLLIMMYIIVGDINED